MCEGRKDLFYTCTSLVAAVGTNPAVAVTITPSLCPVAAAVLNIYTHLEG